MANIAGILAQMWNNPKGIRFNDLCQVCGHYFGTPRQQCTSHRIYRMLWQGDPRVNIQNDKGMAKTYQVKQVIRAIERLQNENKSRTKK